MKNRRKRFFANKLHRELFLWFVAIALLPAVVVAIINYSYILHISNFYLESSNIEPYRVIAALDRATMMLLLFTPLTTILILIVVHRVVCRTVGPFERIIKELEQRIEGEKSGPLSVRRDDKFVPLVAKINELLEKIPKKK